MRSPFFSVAAVSAALPNTLTLTHCTSSSLPTPTRSRTHGLPALEVRASASAARKPKKAQSIVMAGPLLLGLANCVTATYRAVAPRVSQLVRLTNQERQAPSKPLIEAVAKLRACDGKDGYQGLFERQNNRGDCADGVDFARGQNILSEPVDRCRPELIGLLFVSPILYRFKVDDV